MISHAGVGVHIVTVLLTVCAVMAAQPARAAHISGKYLLEMCDIGNDGRERVAGGHAVCQAYIAGVLDYQAFLQGVKLAPKTDICVPKTVTMNQLHALVLKYLKTNPQHDGFIAAPAVITALFQTYPCRAAKRR